MVTHVDPVFNHILTFTYAALFITAAAQKMAHIKSFSEILLGYRLLPRIFLWPYARLIVLAELGVGFGLLISPQAIFGGIGLLSLYAFAISINIIRGNITLDCGCQLGRAQQAISWTLVGRNLVLVMLACGLLLPQTNRPLTLIDFGVIAFGFAISTLIYATVNLLIANQTRARELTS